MPQILTCNTASGHVVYVRTHDHSVGVASDDTVVSTRFNVAAGGAGKRDGKLKKPAEQLPLGAHGLTL